MSEIKYCVRFADGLRERLKSVAKQNHRSMHAEILDRLSRTYEADIAGPAFSSMGERHADKTLLRLDVGMHTSIKEAARSNARSLNAEMVYRLLASFEGDAVRVTPPPMPVVRQYELKALRKTVVGMLEELDRLIGDEAA